MAHSIPVGVWRYVFHLRTRSIPIANSVPELKSSFPASLGLERRLELLAGSCITVAIDDTFGIFLARPIPLYLYPYDINGSNLFKISRVKFEDCVERCISD